MHFNRIKLRLKGSHRISLVSGKKNKTKTFGKATSEQHQRQISIAFLIHLVIHFSKSEKSNL